MLAYQPKFSHTSRLVMFSVFLLIALFALPCLGSSLNGDSEFSSSVKENTQWSVNGHYYELIDEAINWENAKISAESRSFEGLSGHLATITSAAENQFLIDTFGNDLYNHFLGGFQDPGTGDSSDNWHWVTAEPWGETFWGTNEPNGGMEEIYLEFNGPSTPFWNDIGDESRSGFVIEYEAPPVIFDPASEVPAFVHIPSGTFNMGSPSGELGRDDSNEYLHSVTLTKAFWLSPIEVTEQLWDSVMGGVSQAQRPQLTTSWDEAIQFCNALSVSRSLDPAYIYNGSGNVTWNPVANGYRLPTEAEWEYACRAGSQEAFTNGGISQTDCGPEQHLGLIGRYCGNDEGHLSMVGSLGLANAWGLYDLHGNVYEWCWDVYSSNLGTSAETDPLGDGGYDQNTGSERVVRGGSWDNPSRNCRSAHRINRSPSYEAHTVGFRLARSADDPITGVTPSGGLLLGGQEINVGFVVDSAISNIDLHVSYNDGYNWDFIETIPSTSNYQWTVPDVDESQCLIRVSDASDSSVFGVSPAPFQIESRATMMTGVVAYWNFEQNSNDLFGGRLAEHDGSTIIPSGVGGTSCASFTGLSGSFLSYDPADFELDNNFTYSLWFQYNSGTRADNVPLCVSGDWNNNTKNGLIMDVWGTTNVGYLYGLNSSDDSGWNYVSDASYFDGGWHHMAFSKSSTSGAKFYLDGVQVLSDGHLENLYYDSISMFTIGCANDKGETNHFFNGNLDEIGLWDRVLDDGEVSILWNNGVGVNPLAAIVVQFPSGGETFFGGQDLEIGLNIEDTIGNILIEISYDNGFNWEPEGVVPATNSFVVTLDDVDAEFCLVRVSDASDPSVFGVSGAPFEIVSRSTMTDQMVAYWSLDINANDELGSHAAVTESAIHNPNDAAVGEGSFTFEETSEQCLTYSVSDLTFTNDFTYSFWVKRSSTDGTEYMLSVGWDGDGVGTPTYAGLGIASTDGGYGYFYGIESGVNQNSGWNVVPAGQHPDNQWHHICFTKSSEGSDSPGGKMYINGELVASDDLGGDMRYSSWEMLTLGCAQNNETLTGYFSGGLDELVVWDRVLKPNEIVALWNNGTGLNPLMGLQIVSPNGGESYFAGDDISVTWNTNGDIPEIVLEFSGDAGLSWSVLPTSGNLGSLVWPAPLIDSSDCLVRISSANNASEFDTSDAVFTIVQPRGDIVTSAEPSQLPVIWELAYGETTISGEGSGTTENALAGHYTMTWGDIAGWAPTPSTEEGDLEHEGLLNFTTIYEMQPAQITSIEDVANDQGGWVHINFDRCGYDIAGDGWPQTPIMGYTVYREVPQSMASVLEENMEPLEALLIQGNKSADQLVEFAPNGVEIFKNDNRTYLKSNGVDRELPPGTWEAISTVFAMQEEHYTVLAATLADSISGEIPVDTNYFITSHAMVPSVYWSGNVVGGYSTDDIAPDAPGSVAGGYSFDGTQVATLSMTWDLSQANDFDHFVIYRGSSWESAEVAGYSVAPLWDETIAVGDYSSFWVTAVDYVGNEGEAGELSPASGVGGGGIPLKTALLPNYPNPFNPMTKINFALAKQSHVRVAIYSVDGKHIRTLVDDVLEPGSYGRMWDGTNDAGMRVSSGVFFSRLLAGDVVETRKLMLVK